MTKHLHVLSTLLFLCLAFSDDLYAGHQNIRSQSAPIPNVELELNYDDKLQNLTLMMNQEIVAYTKSTLLDEDIEKILTHTKWEIQVFSEEGKLLDSEKIDFSSNGVQSTKCSSIDLEAILDRYIGQNIYIVLIIPEELERTPSQRILALPKSIGEKSNTIVIPINTNNTDPPLAYLVTILSFATVITCLITLKEFVRRESGNREQNMKDNENSISQKISIEQETHATKEAVRYTSKSLGLDSEILTLIAEGNISEALKTAIQKATTPDQLQDTIILQHRYAIISNNYHGGKMTDAEFGVGKIKILEALFSLVVPNS